MQSLIQLICAQRLIESIINGHKTLLIELHTVRLYLLKAVRVICRLIFKKWWLLDEALLQIGIAYFLIPCISISLLL